MQNYYFHHIHLNSTDPQKLADFYEKTFSAKRVGSGNTLDGRVFIDIIVNGPLIRITQPMKQSIVPHISRPNLGIDHLGLKTDDLEKAMTELKEQGAQFVTEIITAPQAKVSFFLDPQDNLFELLEIEE